VAASRLVWGGLLGVGVLLTVSTVDALTRRDGYDPAVHWVSLLARGERAWLGTATLLVAGLLVSVSSVGFAQLLAGRPGGRSTARLVAALGAALLLAGAFPIDPSPGYPRGSAAITPTVSGRIHGVTGVLIVVVLAAMGWTGARLFTGGTARRVSRTSGAVVLASLLLCCLLRSLSSTNTWEAARAGAFQRIALTIGCGWIVMAGLWVLASERSPQTAGDRTGSVAHGNDGGADDGLRGLTAG